MPQIAQASYKAAGTIGQMPKPSGIGSQGELLVWQLQTDDQNTSQGNILCQKEKYYEEIILVLKRRLIS